MKNKKIFVSLISIFLAFLLSLISFIILGSKSLVFRISVIFWLLSIGVSVSLFYKNLSTFFRRGKMARLKLVEAFAIIFFGIAFLSLIKSFDWNIDLTSQGLFKLSSETKNILSQAESPITITLFFYNDPKDSIKSVVDYARKMARHYQAIGRNISFREIDPVKNKILADEYGIIQNGTLIFEQDSRREYILPNILVESINEGEILYKAETIFSAVIEKLTMNKETSIYFLTGNGEVDWHSEGAAGYNGVLKNLKDRRYRLEMLNLDHNPRVPEDANILIIADPKSMFSATVFNSIENFINRGGAVFYFVTQNTTESLNLLLLKSGFAFIQNVAIDPTRVAKNSGEFSIIPSLSPKSEITKLLQRKNLSVIFPSSSAIGIVPEEMTDSSFVYDISPLAKSSSHGFGERKFRSGYYSKDSNDIQGPLDLAASSIVANKDNLAIQHRSIILGSLNFLDNSHRFLGGNIQFFLNAIDFLLVKDLNTTISAKIDNIILSIPTTYQMRLLFSISTIWLFMFLSSGLIILLLRKNKIKVK
ncbi:ABC-type uncharacterized transport system [Brevinema andersonii]|uniref:ABC-type uncharacterized transport system n=1 Tax=Brevinema andersonii TaxID=34097 RepID=A0A1I1D5P2_BREAD|nr:GldG family protein [Brevinema andersonii]SFB70235.1 ABC-type uncharacterized transport system [Brevinema andersonii]